MAANETIEAARRALEDYEHLPFLKKALYRVRGRYPSSEQRDALLYSELGAGGRIIKNALDGIMWTARLNRTPSALFGAAWITASLTGDSPLASLPVTFEPYSQQAATLTEIFTQNGRSATIEDVDGIGFFTDRLGRHDSPLQLAQVTPAIGIVALKDCNVCDALILTKEGITALEPAVQNGLAGLAADVSYSALTTYLDHHPDMAA